MVISLILLNLAGREYVEDLRPLEKERGLGRVPHARLSLRPAGTGVETPPAPGAAANWRIVSDNTTLLLFATPLGNDWYLQNSLGTLDGGIL